MKDVLDGGGDAFGNSNSTTGVVGEAVWQAVIMHKRSGMTNRDMFYPFLCAVYSLDQIIFDPSLSKNGKYHQQYLILHQKSIL